MPEEALLDAAVDVDQPADAVDTSVDDGSDAVDTGDDGTSVQQTDTAELKGSSLWRDLKGPLYSGKSLTKDQIKAVRNAIQAEAQISAKYPEGISAIESTLSAVKSLADDESVPIEQAIQETLQERSYFRELDGLYTSNPAEFAKKIREASPEAFENLAPQVIRQYAETNPEAYSAQMAQSVVQHMNSAEVPLQFRILATFLPQLADGPAKDQVMQAIEAIYGWEQGLRSLSQKKIEPKQVPQTQTQQTGQDPQMQQMDVTRREWNLETRDDGVNMVMSAAQKELSALKKTGLNDAEKKKVLGKVSEELDARLLMDQQYGKSMQGYLKAGNKAAYIQTLNSKRKLIVPAAVKRAVQDVIAERPAKTATQQKQPVNGKPAQTMKPASGAIQFRKISGPPKTAGLIVDLGRTPQSMLVKRQAYIKGEERPVSWG